MIELKEKGVKKMQARSAKDFLRMLDPKDGSFGVEHMSGSSDREQLKKYICNNISKFPFNYQTEIMKFKNAVPVIALPATIIKYYKENSLIYAAHLIDSGVLYVPPQIKNLNVSQLKERLKPASVSRYILKCGESNSVYKNAAKMLQEKSGLSGGSGNFDKYTGRRIYEKIRDKLPKGKGYFASEADPDLLFSPHLEEFIYYVDDVVWKTLGLDIKYCAKDSDSVWKPSKPSSTDTGKDQFWMKDALARGWGPVSKEEYDRRIRQYPSIKMPQIVGSNRGTIYDP